MAPSYSIDIVPIIRHCLAAQRRETQRDALITLAILGSLILAFREIVGILALVYALLCGLRALRHLGQRNVVGAAVQSIVGFILLLIALAFIRTTNADGTSSGLFDVFAAIGASGSRVLLALLVATAGTAAVLMWYRITEHQIILEELTEETFNPARAPAEPALYRLRLAYLQEAQYGNVTIYARAIEDRPFVGSGALVDGWSLAIPLIRTEDGEPGEVPDDGPEPSPPPPPLTVDALYRQVRRALVRLADPEQAEEDRISGLSLQDRIFVRGLLPDSHELIDGDRQPRTRISHQDMLRLARQDRNVATYFLTTRISGWQGELEVTVFLYFNIRGNMLYIEFLGTALPPINARFHIIDTYERMGAGVALRAALYAALVTPSALLNSPLNLADPVIAAIRDSLDLRAQAQQIATRIAFDFGAIGSVREFGAEWNRDNFFHTLDSNRYVHVVERRVIDAMGEVLQEFGYSTADFDQRTSTIIDNSVHDSFNGSNNSAFAVGSNANATNRQSRAPTRAGGGPGPSANADRSRSSSQHGRTS